MDQYGQFPEEEYFDQRNEVIDLLEKENKRMRTQLIWIKRIASQSLTKEGQQDIVRRATEALGGEK